MYDVHFHISSKMNRMLVSWLTARPLLLLASDMLVLIITCAFPESAVSLAPKERPELCWVQFHSMAMLS